MEPETAAEIWRRMVIETILPDLCPPGTPVWEWHRGPEERPAPEFSDDFETPEPTRPDRWEGDE